MSHAFTRPRTAAVIALAAGSLSLTACGSGGTKASQTAISQATSAAAPTTSSASTSSAAPKSTSSSAAPTSTSRAAIPAPITRTVTVTATAQPTSAPTSQAATATVTAKTSALATSQMPTKTARTSSAPTTGTTTTALGAIAPTVIVKAMNTPGRVALLRNTADTMHCEITETYAACGSDPLIVSRAITPASSIDPVWWAQVGLTGRGVAESKADALESSGTTLDPQRILPGQSVTYGSFTCTERANGTTCVNTRTGHGFLITAHTIKPF